MSGGGGGKQETAPWGPQQGYLQDIFRRAQAQSNVPVQQYEGDWIADPTADQQAGWDLAREYATGNAQQIAQGAQSALGLLTNADVMLNPDANPYLQRYIQASINPVMQNLQRNVLPQIGSAAVAQGAYSGSRPQIAQAVAAGDASRHALDTTATISSAAYGQGLDAMTRGVALSPTVMQLGYMPSQMLREIGTEQQAQAQAEIDALRERFEREQMAGWDNLARYSAIIQGGQWGSQTSQEGPGRAKSALGGAAAGAALGSVIPGVGTAVGAGLGALYGLL